MRTVVGHILKTAQGALGGLPPSSRRAYAARSLPFPESRKGAGGTYLDRETDRPKGSRARGNYLNGPDGIRPSRRFPDQAIYAPG
jgi:hypothetical protein